MSSLCSPRTCLSLSVHCAPAPWPDTCCWISAECFLLLNISSSSQNSFKWPVPLTICILAPPNENSFLSGLTIPAIARHSSYKGLATLFSTFLIDLHPSHWPPYKHTFFKVLKYVVPFSVMEIKHVLFLGIHEFIPHSLVVMHKVAIVRDEGGEDFLLKRISLLNWL